MKNKEINTYAELMQKWGLSKLSVTEEGSSLVLERPQAMGMDFAGEGRPEKAKGSEVSSDAADVITSPMVGVFYASPAENEEPYVSVGEHVKSGQTLCIIEAMKLMNEIRAEADGVIEDICVTNGQMVEYGTALFRVRKEAS